MHNFKFCILGKLHIAPGMVLGYLFSGSALCIVECLALNTRGGEVIFVKTKVGFMYESLK